jgi:hypothetical protein
VRRHDKRGDAVLEDSATIEPASLSLTGRRLTWTSARTARSATLQ